MTARTNDSIMIEERAAHFATRSIKGASKELALRLAMSMIDLTTLEGADSPATVRALCRRAIRPCAHTIDPPAPSVAAVCVYPSLIPIARDELAGSSVRVASVASAFPSGQYPLDIRLADVRDAIEAGADEIDMVISRGAFLAGRVAQVADEIRQIKQVCGKTRLKIILETGELETYDNIRRASDLAIEAATSVPGASTVGDGEVFLKTSTGKVQPAATMPVTLVLIEAIRDHDRATGMKIGIKPAGGIRAAKLALHYLVMVKETLGEPWLSSRLFRFGASGLADDLLRQLRKQANGTYAAAYDVPTP